MKKKTLLTLFTLGGLLGVSSMLLAAPRFTETKALNETVGSFTVIAGENYTASANEISTTSGNFILEQSALGNDYHLTLVAQPDKQNGNGDYGIIFNGSYADGKLSGDSAKIWYDPGYNDWRIEIGYYVEDVYTNIGVIWCEFTDGAAKTFDFYVSDGEVGFRMNNWHIGNFHLVNTSGNLYVFSKGVAIDYQGLTVEQMARPIGHYSYRYNWGGTNFFEMCDCFPANAEFSFTMTLPNTVDKAAVEALYLQRTTWFANNQNMNVKLNNESLADWASVPQRGNNAFTDDVYEIPVSKMPNNGVFNVVLKPTEGTSVNGHFKLLYKLSGKLYCGDVLVLGAPISETAHNYDKTNVDYHGYQKHFMPMWECQSYALMGSKPGAEIKRVDSPVLLAGNPVNIVMPNSTPVTVNFEDYMVNPIANGFEPQRIELWWPDIFVGNTHSYTFENQNFSSTYYADYWFDEMDQSAGGWIKASATSTINVIAAAAHTITFHSIGGITIEPQVKYGNEVSVEPTAPTLARHTFLGWFTEEEGGTQFVFGSALTADIDLYAHWSLDTNENVIAFATKLLEDTENFGAKTQEQKEAAWVGLKAAWDALAEDEQNVFITNSISSSVIADAQSRYQCIMSRQYTSVGDFIYHTSNLSPVVRPFSMNVNRALLIACLSVIGVITIGGIALLVRKFKKN